MNTTILIWIFVSAFLRLKLLEIGKEREEFFIAGDPTSAVIKDDYDDIDD